MERSNWPNKLDYHLSLFSYILGFATLWRFPYLAYENGGAPFVYAYLVLYVLVGIPLLFLEMAWGQYSNQAPLQAFKAVPVMQGIGISILFLSLGVLIYFGVVSYYMLVYLTASFSYSIPYTTCGNEWNVNCKLSTDLDYRCVSQDDFDPTSNDTTAQVCNYTFNSSMSTPALQYWKNRIKSNDNLCTHFPSSGVDTLLFGSTALPEEILLSPIYVLAIFVGGRILLAMLAVAKHVRFTGKIAYLISTIPFAVSVMMLVRCSTLPGALSGLQYLFVPNLQGTFLTHLISPQLWKDAMSQIFISLLTTWGGLLTWSSFGTFYNKYHYDATVIILVVPLLSALSSIAMFSVIGCLATSLDVQVKDVMADVDAPMVPLVALTEALSRMWGHQLPWCLVVFVTYFLSSVASVLPSMECLLSSLSDTFTTCRGYCLRNLSVLLLLLFTISAHYLLPCFFQGSGLDMIAFFDDFNLPLCFMLVALAECLLIAWAFGHNSLLQTNIKAMTANSCLRSCFWTIMWRGITPLVLLLCITFTIYGTALQEDGILDWSSVITWPVLGGAGMVGFIFLLILLVAVIKIVQSPGTCGEKFHSAFSPVAMVGNGNNDVRGSNGGNMFMNDYTSHRGERGIEVLIDEDIVTTV